MNNVFIPNERAKEIIEELRVWKEVSDLLSSPSESETPGDVCSVVWRHADRLTNEYYHLVQKAIKGETK